ncbi:class I SAM-dependent methyltransferase [Christensenellaceae bacterium OttesenSCG-928-M15]|nr:class I SAM-dependent methyltransferase [Christensenellaceae bacterium OttesenSCG-928-M15]
MDTAATQDDYLSYYKYGAIAPKYYKMFGKEETDRYYAHILGLLKPYLSSNSRLLDVAGAWGELAKFLSDKGLQNIVVADANENCVNAAQEKGIVAKQCTSLDMAEAWSEKFDIIILNHTLEHILNVQKTMENIHALLKDGGHLFIEIPDAASYANEESAPFNFLTYEHVLHLTANDLKNLAAVYGYHVVEMGEYYKKVSSYPSIYAVLEKTGIKKAPTHSDIGKTSMERYIEKSKQMVDQFLAPLRASAEPLVLWGIGASTAILIDSFSGCNVRALIDSNPQRQGLAFAIDGNKYVIESPETVREGTIVILSIPYHTSIEKQIRAMGLQNKIVALT